MMPPPHMNINMPPPSKFKLNSLKTLLKIELIPNCFIHLDALMPPNMMNVPPQMVPPPHNMNMGIGPGPPGMPPMMPPPVINPSIPPNRGNEDHRNNQQQIDKRNESAPPPAWRSRETRPDKERDYRERDRG